MYYGTQIAESSASLEGGCKCIFSKPADSIGIRAISFHSFSKLSFSKLLPAQRCWRATQKVMRHHALPCIGWWVFLTSSLRMEPNLLTDRALKLPPAKCVNLAAQRIRVTCAPHLTPISWSFHNSHSSAQTQSKWRPEMPQRRSRSRYDAVEMASHRQSFYPRPPPYPTLGAVGGIRLASSSTPLSCTSQTMEDYDVVNALSSVVKYINASTHHEAPSEALNAIFTSLRPPSERSSAQAQLSSIDERLALHRRRTTNGRRRITKHCKVLGCGNISVSRGLCRGHGGGRRCHYIGCSKSAQSRSVFCWSHGGGHRCEVESCMRSRKSKRFCADHVSLESELIPETNGSVVHPKVNSGRCLPGLQEALRSTQQSSLIL